MDVDDAKFELTFRNITDIQSPLFWAICDDDDDWLLMKKIKESNAKQEYVGKGNARAGFRRPYVLYQPSDIYQRILSKGDIWHKYAIFEKEDFDELIEEIKMEWEKPRYGTQQRSRKHPIQSSILGTFGILRAGETLLQREAHCGIDDSLIHIDLYRNVEILVKQLEDEIYWPSHNEQVILIGLNEDFESCLIIDCMDIPLATNTKDWYRFIFKSWKCGEGYRNLLVVDVRGMIRAVLSIPSGFNNDQAVLKTAEFFRRGSLLPGSSALGDGGFWGSDEFPIDRPWTAPQTKSNPDLKHYNRAVSKHKNIVERVNGIVTGSFRILKKDFPYRPSFFPIVFLLCCQLTNRYFRLYGYPACD